MQGGRRAARRPAAGDRRRAARRRCSPGRPRPTASWRGPRWCCCGRRGPTRRVLPIPAAERRASASSGRWRTRSRRTGSAPTRATATAISSGSRRRSPGSGGTGRRRFMRGVAITRGARRRRSCDEAAALAGGATPCGAVPGRAARVERGIGDAGGAAAAVCPAPAGRGGAPGQRRGEADRLRHRRAGAAYSARGRGGRRRDLLDGAPRQLRGRRHRRHPRRGREPDRQAVARAADRRRDHLGLRLAAGADRPAAGAGGGGVGGAAAAASLVRLLSRPRGALAGGLLPSARATPTLPSSFPTGRSPGARSRSRPGRRSPPACG